MTNADFPLATSRTATLMETIMKPLSYAGRPVRWLMAAGLALAAMQAVPARTQPAADVPLGLDLDPGPTHHPRPGEAEPFFTKTGEQLNCDYVRYTLRFGAAGDPAKFLDPAFIAEMQNVRLDFRDTLPAGLEIVDVKVSGDGTDAAGGPLPAPTVSTTTNPNDTVKLDDFRLSTSDLDGSGEIGSRYVDFVIAARIDHAAFPAPKIVVNQGFVGIILVGGPAILVPSHDPELPDDGDFRTGEPTKILIDVERCDRPPPPPPGEACFKVETGTVDCVPGGGAFIYHMPVGPDLGGKWVQLRTTTPGVTVAPLSQLAPIGGGVLNWTITGASPGDVVQLVVTGVETYAGPEEGVGLCCSQTVDIVIPRDLRCPPQHHEPDIKVEKRADVARCTPEGGCDFTIRVTNVGDGPYNGPIVLDEVTAPGSAAVVSGPNPPWACAPMASPMSCTHPATTLDPGEWVELKLGFAPGPGWDWNVIRNCAEYDYTASGKPDVFGSTANDKACASIPICRRGDPRCDPPVEKKVDLRITKDSRSVACTADGVCWFNIRVFNNGSENYVGPLTVVDEYPTGVPAASTFGPNPPWTCGPIGGGQFQCDHPGVNLAPGAFIPITVRAVVNDDYPGDIIRNCAQVNAITGEADLANNRACAQMRIPNREPGQPALRITKTCEDTAGAAAVSCRITVTSVGTATPTGPVRVADAATILGTATPVQILTVTPDGGEWACGPVPANALSCQIPGAVMTPGTSRHFDVTVQDSGYARFENCARGSWGPAPGNDIVYPFGEACAQGGTTIHVEKTGDKECTAGMPCTFEITITNDGPTGFSGPVRIGDAIGVGGTRLEGVEITEISPPFGCSPEPTTLPMSCVATLSLGPGESRVHQVTVVIPEGPFANNRQPVPARNCVGVVSPDTPVASAERMMSSGAATTGRPGAEPYACHDFTVGKPVVEECSKGFVMNDAGRCVCPQGTSFRNGQCRPTGGEPPPPPPPPPGVGLCKLLPGQIRTQDGRCVCPRGTELVRGECRRLPPPQCELLPGQIRTKDGRCVCPRGTSLIKGQCREVEVECPRGTVLRKGRCVNIELECPRGSVLSNGRCVKIERETCPRGFVGTPPNCRRIQIDQQLQQLIDPKQRQKLQIQ
ncbi:MAG: EB domain-containing protein [Hyphomicrobiales bacterium]|nr:EB domain-containing protein [Hyphomicrobiales bacterium]